ncbi:MAG: type VI secretion system tip protein TssI/VgrG [Steroidobacteraceae bacterium]
MAASRRIALHSVLGPDQLMIKDATVREELGRMSVMDLDLLSPDENLALDDLLGRGFSVELVLDGDKSRFFHGIIAECSQIGRLGSYARYSAKVVPWLWFLTRTSDCRIFQQKSVPDIIKSVFREHGTSDFEDSLSGSYSPRDYCVQYMETDFDFVSRLMEEEGIYYFFKHEQDKDTLVLCDGAGAHSATPGCEKVTYYPPSDNVVREEDIIDHWLLSHTMQSGKLTHTDFDFIKPRTSLLAQHAAAGTYPKGDAEVFAYPGGYLTVGDGSKYAQRRLEALQQQHERAVGSGNVRALAVGALFTLENYPRDDQNREYLVVSSLHHFGGMDFESGVSHASVDVTVTFEAIPSKQPYRSLSTTRRARVAGPQTAIVVGKAGEEIYTDQYGRVKVQFHWDRQGKRDENSSCWVRVSQVWAGKNWGAMHIPRIGQEVIVDFLEGDPDRPIITGRIYNAAEMPPYDLPANQTQSGIKSRSSKGGSPANFNEIRFEDKMGSEMLTIHAEKDQEISVEHDESHTVGHDRTKSVTHDETTTVGNNRTESVGNNEQITIGVNRTENVGSNETITIGSNRTISVGQNESATVALMRTHSVGVNESINVGAAQEISIGAAQTITVGAVQAVSVGANQTISVGSNRTLNVGSNETVTVGANETMNVGADEARSVTGGRATTIGKDDALSVTKNLTISAGDSITITTGDASISMKKDGTITISGKDITVNGSGKINLKASSDIVMKGSSILQN